MSLAAVLLCPAGWLHAGRILVTGDYVSTTTQSYLSALGHSSTLVNPLDFGTASFAGYDAIWIGWTPIMSGVDARRADLTDFVTQGGNLVVELGTWSPYWMLPYGTELTSFYGVGESVRVRDGSAPADANHGLLQGLASAELSDWEFAYHHYFTGLGGFAGAADIGADGFWVTVVRRVGSGYLVYTGQDMSFHMLYMGGASSAAARLLDNALTLEPLGTEVPEPRPSLLLGLGLPWLAVSVWRARSRHPVRR